MSDTSNALPPSSTQTTLVQSVEADAALIATEVNQCSGSQAQATLTETPPAGTDASVALAVGAQTPGLE